MISFAKAVCVQHELGMMECHGVGSLQDFCTAAFPQVLKNDDLATMQL